MEIQIAGLLATSALSSVGLIVTAVESRRRRKLLRVQFADQSMDRYMTFQNRFYGLLGAPDDGVQPPEWRKLMVAFFNFYARLFVAHRLDVFPREHWEDLRVSLAHWARRPEICKAWAEFSQQGDEWPAGFVAFVNGELSDVASQAESTWDNHPPDPRAWARLREELGS